MKPFFTSTIKQTIRPSRLTRQTQTFRMSSSATTSTNEHGQGASHATDSQLPGKIQEAAPKTLEKEIPDSIHDTGSNKETGKVSHATGPSKVPQAIQEAAPEALEKALPESIHPTNPK